MENKTLRVGFIGVGSMGRPMVTRLLTAGFACTIYDLNPVPLQALAAEGAQVADSVAEVAQASDVFITMVVNDQQFLATLFEPGNAALNLSKGAVVIGMSTMSMNTVKAVAVRLKELEIEFLDVPVSGGVVGATAGTLSLMAGGDQSVLEYCRPVLSAIGTNLYHVGANIGDGQAVKMINQLLVSVHNAVAAEALTLGEKVGLDKQMLFEIIKNSAGNSWIFSDRGTRMVSENFDDVKSALNILLKDIGFVVESADKIGYPLVLGSAAHQLYKMAAARGLGTQDDASLITLTKELAGLENNNDKHGVAGKTTF